MRIQKISRKKFQIGENLNHPPHQYHYTCPKTKMAFLTNFTKFSWNFGWKIENDLYLLRLVADNWHVLDRADPFTDLRHISKILIYRCAGLGVLIFRHAPAMESGRTSPGVFIADLVLAWLQNFRAHKLKAIISEYLHLWTRRTPTEPHKPYKTYKSLIDIIKAIICIHCQIVKVRKMAVYYL